MCFGYQGKRCDPTILDIDQKIPLDCLVSNPSTVIPSKLLSLIPLYMIHRMCVSRLLTCSNAPGVRFSIAQEVDFDYFRLFDMLEFAVCPSKTVHCIYGVELPCAANHGP